MSTDEPEYRNWRSLAAKAGVSRSRFFEHLALDVGGLRTRARVEVPGLGVLYDTRKSQKYLAMVEAGRKLKTERKSKAERRAS